MELDETLHRGEAENNDLPLPFKNAALCYDGKVSVSPFPR